MVVQEVTRVGGGGGGGELCQLIAIDSAVGEEAEETIELLPNQATFHRLLHNHPQGDILNSPSRLLFIDKVAKKMANFNFLFFIQNHLKYLETCTHFKSSFGAAPTPELPLT